MGIRFECPNGHKLHVKEILAGKRGICPACDAKFMVPMTDGAQAGAIAETEEAGQGEPPAPPARVTVEAPVSESWYVQLETGEKFGPANQEMMQSWIVAGRVLPDSLVWRTGWEAWKPASEGLVEFQPSTSPPQATPPQPTEESVRPEVPTIVVEDRVDPRPKKNKLRKSSARGRRERARTMTIWLGALVLLLTAIFLIVVFRQEILR